MEINKTNIVLTGAASGIGLAILQKLQQFDCRIIAADKDSAQLEKVTLAYINRVTPFVGDLSNPDQVDQLFDFAINSLGSVDLFIANAGFAYYGQLHEASWSYVEQIFRINTLSPIYSLLKMRQINPHGNWKTVMISSAMAEWAVPGYTFYGATKAAVHRFADGYRFESSGKNLMVVYPISTRTNFFQTAGNQIPMAFPVQSAESVALKIISGIRHDRRKVYPSKLFLFIFLLNRILFFIKPAYQLVEFGKLKKWITKTTS